jgi:hypothetical protein
MQYRPGPTRVTLVRLFELAESRMPSEDTRPNASAVPAGPGGPLRPRGPRRPRGRRRTGCAVGGLRPAVAFAFSTVCPTALPAAWPSAVEPRTDTRTAVADRISGSRSMVSPSPGFPGLSAGEYRMSRAVLQAFFQPEPALGRQRRLLAAMRLALPLALSEVVRRPSENGGCLRGRGSSAVSSRYSSSFLSRKALRTAKPRQSLLK